MFLRTVCAVLLLLVVTFLAPELCSSMLHYEGKESETLCTLEASLSPRAKSTRQQSHMQTAPWSTRESYGTVMHVTPMPQSHGVSGQTLTSHSDLLLEADPVTMRQRRDLSQWDDPYGQEQVLPPVVNVGGGRYMEPGIGTVGMNGALFRALGQSEGLLQLSISLSLSCTLSLSLSVPIFHYLYLPLCYKYEL